MESQSNKVTSIEDNQTIIHTQFYGDIYCVDILESIEQWLLLIIEHPIQFLLFDYTHANMDNLTKEDAKTIAEHTQKIVIENPFIKLIGIMPNEADYNITNIWCALSTTHNSIVEYSNIGIVKNLNEAMYIVSESRLTP